MGDMLNTESCRCINNLKKFIIYLLYILITSSLYFKFILNFIFLIQEVNKNDIHSMKFMRLKELFLFGQNFYQIFE